MNEADVISAAGTETGGGKGEPNTAAVSGVCAVQTARGSAGRHGRTGGVWWQQPHSLGVSRINNTSSRSYMCSTPCLLRQEPRCFAGALGRQRLSAGAGPLCSSCPCSSRPQGWGSPASCNGGFCEGGWGAALGLALNGASGEGTSRWTRRL